MHPLAVEMTSEFVHAVVCDEPGEWLSGIEASDPSHAPSDAVRDLARRDLAARFGGGLSVAQRGRVPVLHRRGEPLPADLSLSHHGRFVAFACASEASEDSSR